MSSNHKDNPFVGLRPFEPEESILFFGRQEQVAELLGRLHHHHFVAIIGGSGTGKSSLIRAGFIPALKAGYMVTSSTVWRVLITKPGDSPLNNLAAALLSLGKSDQLKNQLFAEGADAVVNFIKARSDFQDENYFLLIDQFEEIFAFSRSANTESVRDEANQYVNLLIDLAAQRDINLYVVITMRSEFLGDCTLFNPLAEAINKSQYLVPRLTRQQLKSVIEGPVRLFGADVSPMLTAKLLNDIYKVEDGLPLLQHTLMRIWYHEHRVDKSGELDLKDYASVGDIDTALDRHATEMMAEMDTGEKEMVKRIFQALTTVDSYGRKVRRPLRLRILSELLAAEGNLLLSLVEKINKDARSFIIVNKSDSANDPLLDISHESLIRQWEALNGWVDEEARNVENLRYLVKSGQLHEKKLKDVLVGAELNTYASWYDRLKPSHVWGKLISDDFAAGIGYLHKSRGKAKTRQTIRVQLTIGGAILSVLLLFFLLKQQQKKELQQAARLQEWRLRIEQSMKDGNGLKALLYYSELLQVGGKKDSALLAAQSLWPKYRLGNALDAHREIDRLQFHNNHELLIYDGDTCFRWNTVTGALTRDEGQPLGNLDSLRQLVENSKAQLYKQWGYDDLSVFFLENQSEITAPRDIRTITKFSLPRDQHSIMAWGLNIDSTWSVYLFDPATGKQLTIPMIHQADIYTVMMSDDNAAMASSGNDSSVRYWTKWNEPSHGDADLDIPVDLFQLQVSALTGARLNATKTAAECLSVPEWKKLQIQWSGEAEKHYKTCRHKSANVWARLNSK